MPELPEVETVCRGLDTLMTGRRIARLVVRRPDLRLPLPPELAAVAEGRRVLRIHRRAKYWILDLERGWSILGHLGMSGRITARAAGEAVKPHDHIDWVMEAGPTLVLNDPRRFGMVTCHPTPALPSHPWLASLGPEPLSPSFTAAHLAGRVAGRASPIKALLLDQTVVAGLGNIYVAEALYHARIRPDRQGRTLTGGEIALLVAAVRQVLTAAIAAGGSSLRDYVRTDGGLGYFQHAWAVYGREGEACPDCDCDRTKSGGITRIVQSNRSTFFCPTRQR